MNNGGWTADELKKIGLAAPDKVQRVQRRRKAVKNSTGSSDEAAPKQTVKLAATTS